MAAANYSMAVYMVFLGADVIGVLTIMIAQAVKSSFPRSSSDLCCRYHQYASLNIRLHLEVKVGKT